MYKMTINMQEIAGCFYNIRAADNFRAAVKLIQKLKAI